MRYARGSNSSNPTTQPGYVIGSDASGNPIYAAPPLNEVVTGYDAQGNPVYGTTLNISTPVSYPVSMPSYPQQQPSYGGGRRWGWRNGRMQGLGAFYLKNSFPLPTTGRGPFLLQPGITARPSVNGGLGDYVRMSTANPTGWRPWNSRLGQTEIFGLEVDPTLLFAGVGVLLLAIYLLGSGRPKRKARRLRKRISRSQSQLRELQAV